MLGALLVGYLDDGTAYRRWRIAQCVNGFVVCVVLPAVLQWLSSIAWTALAGLFGGEALAVLLGIPLLAVLILLALQGVVGFFGGDEVIDRVQAVLTVVLFTTFVVFAVKLARGHGIHLRLVSVLTLPAHSSSR